jgi:hypothetical protein
MAAWLAVLAAVCNAESQMHRAFLMLAENKVVLALLKTYTTYFA